MHVNLLLLIQNLKFLYMINKNVDCNTKLNLILKFEHLKLFYLITIVCLIN